MAIPGNRHCANCIGALSFPISAVLIEYVTDERTRTRSHITIHIIGYT